VGKDADELLRFDCWIGRPFVCLSCTDGVYSADDEPEEGASDFWYSGEAAKELAFGEDDLACVPIGDCLELLCSE